MFSTRNSGKSRLVKRRHFLTVTATATVASLLPSRTWLNAAESTNSSTVTPMSLPQRYKIAVCDWMILKRQKLGAFPLAKEIGADGVEVDMGSLGQLDTFDSQLNKPEVRQQFLDTARDL